MHSVQSIAQQLLDLLFPPRCAGCPRSGTVLCSTCMASIQPIPQPFCRHCHAPLGTEPSCRRCSYRPLQFSGLRSASTYQGVLRTCIHALKYDGITRLAQPLGRLLARTWSETGLGGDLVIPVPLHPQRQRRRGYNHAALLARTCAQEAGMSYSDSLLERIRDTQAQVHLSPEERARNVAGAFRCTAGHTTQLIAGKDLILVDDVFTTGATLEECAAPLFAAGARRIWGLVLARPL